MYPIGTPFLTTNPPQADAERQSPGGFHADEKELEAAARTRCDDRGRVRVRERVELAVPGSRRLAHPIADPLPFAPREPAQGKRGRRQDRVERHVPAREKRRVVKEGWRAGNPHARPRGRAVAQVPGDRHFERVEALRPVVSWKRQARVALEEPGGIVPTRPRARLEPLEIRHVRVGERLFLEQRQEMRPGGAHPVGRDTGIPVDADTPRETLRQEPRGVEGIVGPDRRARDPRDLGSVERREVLARPLHRRDAPRERPEESFRTVADARDRADRRAGREAPRGIGSADPGRKS